MKEGATPWRPPFREIRAALAARGFRPSRRLGQNLLLDPSLHEAIVAAAEVVPGDRVLEIGAGAGFLTAHLLAAGAEVLAVEVDRRLAEVAREVLGERASLKLVEADILAGKGRLDPEVAAAAAAHAGGRGLKVVANLPYSVSGPVLSLLAVSELPLTLVVCLVQKELGSRLAAAPGGREWGTLGLARSLRFEAEVLRDVSPRVFRPQPKVASSLVRLRPLPVPLAAPGPEAAGILAVARRLLVHRGKTLRGALKAAGVVDLEACLAVLPGEGMARIETLDPPRWVRLGLARGQDVREAAP